MDKLSPVLGILLFLIMLIINFILFGFSSGVQHTSETETKSKRLLKIMEKPGKLINTIQMISATSSLLTGVFLVRGYGGLLYSLFSKASNSAKLNLLLAIFSYFIVLIIIVIFLLTFAIIVPKKLAEKKPEKWANNLVNIVTFLMVVFTPLNIIINYFAKIILKLFKINIDEEAAEVTEEEIMSMINEGHEQGTILASEAEMITNIFEMSEKEAEDIMTNRKNIIAVNADWTLNETLNFILQENNSRFPVYLDNIDNIIGILYLRDIMLCCREDEDKSISIKDIPNILRKATFIPESSKIDMIFKDMQSEKIHMKIVIDEYGQTAGLITMEDILEEIVGNIFDEYDEIENNIILQEDGSFLIRGMTLLEDIEEVVGIDYGDTDYDTLNGFLIFHLDRIPETNELIDIDIDGYKYKILSTENKMISLVKLILPKEEEVIEKEED